MIEGVVSPEFVPVIRITFVGISGREVQIDTSLDTGFDSDFSLPLIQIQALGWDFSEERIVALGNGSEVRAAIHRGIAIWHGNPRLVSVYAFESKPLLGTGLLWRNELKIQFKPGGSVSILPLP